MAGPVLIMAGGTGGHVFPALAVAKVLRERGVGVVWLGVPASMESRLVPANGFPIEWVRVRGIRGKGLAAWLLAPLRILNAVMQTMAVLRRVRPRAVLGAGGYVSGPGGIAAWLMRIPLLIHEQNAIPGLRTNRWLARVAGSVLQAFSRQFCRQRARAHGGQPRACGHRRHRGTRGAVRGAQRADATARVRRQPGRAALEFDGAAGAGTHRTRATPVGPTSSGRARFRGGARRLCRGAGHGGRHAVHR